MKRLKDWLYGLIIRVLDFIHDIQDPTGEIRSSPFYKSWEKSMYIHLEEKELARIIKKVMIRRMWKEKQLERILKLVHSLNHSLLFSIAKTSLNEEAYKMYIEESIKLKKLFPIKDLDLLSERDARKELIRTYETVLKNEAYSQVVWTFISTMFGSEMGVDKKHELVGELLNAVKRLTEDYSRASSLEEIKSLRKEPLSPIKLLVLIFNAKFNMLKKGA